MFIIANEGDDMTVLNEIEFDEIYEHLNEGTIIYDIETNKKLESNAQKIIAMYLSGYSNKSMTLATLQNDAEFKTLFQLISLIG